MTKGNLYYYFKNKEEILYVCHDFALDLVLAQLKDVQRSGDPPEQKLHRLIAGFVHLFIDVLQGGAWTLEVDALSPVLRQKVVAKRDRFDRGFRGIIESGMDSGVFAPGNPKMLSFAILGAINWIPRWFNPEGSAKADEIASAFADYFTKGLLATSIKQAESSPRRKSAQSMR
jgi:TetR/AcrR family transcriptional regulator